MSEYIDRDQLQTALARKKSGPADKRYTEGWNDCLMRVKSMVSTAPAVDVAPVVHGRWEHYSTTMMVCSICGKHVAWHRYNYCPNCGARMDGDPDGLR